MPIISIIIPVYKVEQYLEKCVESVLAQTFHDYELILVDDGSPDQCGEICDRYALSDSRIKVIHKTNGGLSDARNAALDIITGAYITFIDSDDYVAPNHIESLYESLTRNNADMAIANISSVINGKVHEDFYQPFTSETVIEGKSVFDTLFQPCAQAKLYKKSLYQNIHFPVGRLYEDMFIYHDILAQVNRIAMTGMNTYYYLIRKNSILHQDYKYEFTDIIDALTARIHKLEELGLREMADKNRVFIYSRVAVAFAYLDPTVPKNKKRLREIKKIYNKEYPKLVKKTYSIKQQYRYFLLFVSPKIHTRVFGRKMRKVLG